MPPPPHTHLQGIRTLTRSAEGQRRTLAFAIYARPAALAWVQVTIE